jgi:N6-adenosine-specific RNA methylase IME4
MTNKAKFKETKCEKVDLFEFSHLYFDSLLMTDGLVFIWVEKETIYYITKFMENQGFKYVENFAWVMLDPTKRACKKFLTTFYRGSRKAPLRCFWCLF